MWPYQSASKFRGNIFLLARIALFVAIYLVLDAMTNALLSLSPALAVVQPVPLRVGLIRETVALATVLASTCLMAAIEKRPLSDYGYRSEGALRRFGIGLVCGLLALSALIGCIYLAGAIRFTGMTRSLVDVIPDAMMWACVFLMIGTLEESIFRGYLQHALSRGVGFWWAALLVSATFMTWHLQNNGETPLGLLATGLGSFAFCLSLWYTRSLWWAIGFHTGWDWGQSFLYGTPDSGVMTRGSLFLSAPSGPSYLSGGSVGPEGSILLIPCFVVLILLMWLAWGVRSPFRRRK